MSQHEKLNKIIKQSMSGRLSQHMVEKISPNISDTLLEHGTFMRWHDAKTNPPKEDGEYIVYAKNLTGYWKLDKPVFVAQYSLGEWIFQGWEDNHIIAWMNLPKPPQKNKGV